MLYIISYIIFLGFLAEIILLISFSSVENLFASVLFL